MYFYHWDTVPKNEMAAMTSSFRQARKAIPAIDAAFKDGDFWEMYKLPRLLRHHAAHRGPIVAHPIYSSNEEFTDEQLDDAAGKHGYYDDLRVFERRPDLSEEMRTWLVAMARFKAKLKLLGRPLKHAVMLKDGGKTDFTIRVRLTILIAFWRSSTGCWTSFKPWSQASPGP